MRYVFLLHGIGINPPGWSQKIRTVLSEKAVFYAARSGETPQPVQFVELRFDHVLERNIGSFLDGGGSLSPVNDWLREGWDQRGPNAKLSLNSFIRDFALDVACYLWGGDTMVEILETIAETMVETIMPGPKKNDFYLLCHSLGTKIGCDLLNLLYEPAGGSNPAYPNINKLHPLFSLRPNGDPTRTSPDFSGLYLIANVAPLLNRFDNQSYDANSSHVRISIPGTQGGIIRNHFRIFNNHYDPVARCGGTNLINPSVYTHHTVIAQANDWLMHFYEQYLDHPLVHIPLIEDFYGLQLSEPVKLKAIQDFESGCHLPAIEATLETALSLLPEYNPTDPQKGLLSFLFETARKLGTITNDSPEN